MKSNKHHPTCKEYGFSISVREDGLICWYTLEKGGLQNVKITKDEATKRVNNLIKLHKPVPPAACRMLGIAPPEQKKQSGSGNQKPRKKRKWEIRRNNHHKQPVNHGLFVMVTPIKKINYYSNTYQIFSLQV